MKKKTNFRVGLSGDANFRVRLFRNTNLCGNEKKNYFLHHPDHSIGAAKPRIPAAIILCELLQTAQN